MWAVKLGTAAVLLGKIQVEALPYFAIIQAAKPRPLPTDIIHTVLWFYSLGHWQVSHQSRVLFVTNRTNSGNVLEGCGNPTGSTRSWWTGNGKDRSSVDGEADRPVAAQTLRPARCCILSSLFLTSKNQHPRRDWLAKVSVHDHSLAVQGQGRKEMAPFASLERSIWICVPTKTSHH